MLSPSGRCRRHAREEFHGHESQPCFSYSVLKSDCFGTQRELEEMSISQMHELTYYQKVHKREMREAAQRKVRAVVERANKEFMAGNPVEADRFTSAKRFRDYGR